MGGGLNQILVSSLGDKENLSSFFKRRKETIVRFIGDPMGFASSLLQSRFSFVLFPLAYISNSHKDLSVVTHVTIEPIYRKYIFYISMSAFVSNL